MKKLVFLFLIVPSFLCAQSSKKDSLWLPLQPFIGEWTGVGGGEPGTGKYERSYTVVLGGNFIEIRNKSSYPPTANNPAGEVHEDIG